MEWKQLHGESFAGGLALVTGGAGFIGSHLVEALVSLGATVTVLDDLSGGRWQNLEGFGAGVRPIEGSILDRSALAEATAGCDWVFHQAALGSVPRSVAEPVRYHEVNVMGTVQVLEAARAAGSVRRVIYAGSSSAYGDPPVDGAKVETMPPLPRSPYAATKLGGEHAMRAWAHSYGLDTAVLRYFNIFGPRQRADSAYAAVIAAFAKAMLDGRPATIFGDGQTSRDFTFVANAVHANLLAARCDKPLMGEAFNIATGRRVNLLQLHEAMAYLLGRQGAAPVHEPERAGDVRYSLADITRAKQTLGYVPLVTFEQGLEKTVQWYRSQYHAAERG